MKFPKDSIITDLFASNNLYPYATYLCGDFYVAAYVNTVMSIAYCAFIGDIPENIEPSQYIALAANAAIIPKKETTTLLKPTPKLTRKEPRKKATNNVIGLQHGKYVTLLYSKAANEIYYGRSTVSVDDAVEKTNARCAGTDCKNIYVTNNIGCVSFAQNDYGSWGKARGDSAQDAAATALMYCNQHSFEGECTITSTLCPE